MWVRGLKHLLDDGHITEIQSHPMWVRGLKPSPSGRIPDRRRRTLCGCVD